jgi:hypothetical protein
MIRFIIHFNIISLPVVAKDKFIIKMFIILFVVCFLIKGKILVLSQFSGKETENEKKFQQFHCKYHIFQMEELPTVQRFLLLKHCSQITGCKSMFSGRKP